MPSILQREQDIRRIVEEKGQEHVFRFWDELGSAEREHLLGQLDMLDFDEVDRLIRQHVGSDTETEELPHLEPAPYIRLPQTEAERHDHAAAGERGEAEIRAGHVAAFVLAGGQGTRLGFDGPKGCFPIAPISQKTLFQLFAERILAARRKYDAAIPWYVMTNRDNDDDTQAFFAEHDCFGLPADDVFFFRQGLMPVVDQNGRLLMDSPSSLALSPDGHGGAIRALKRSGALDDMTRRGVRHISHIQVDNILVRPIDPVFIGFHLQTGSQMSSRMVKKSSSDERVGHFCLVDGKLRVVEYSDMPADLAEKRRPNGELVFGAGSIAIHIYDVDFVEQLNQAGYELPFHRAWKKVPYVNELSHRIRPRTPNANKFEMFIFDALPAAQKTMVLEAAREELFSPVKNATGRDSVESARKDMMRRDARWCRAAGIHVDSDDEDVPEHKIEVSPLFAPTCEDFVERMSGDQLKAITRDTYFDGEQPAETD